jgi:hypothetical protein
MVSGEQADSPSPYRFIDRLKEVSSTDEKVKVINKELIIELERLAYTGSLVIADIQTCKQKISPFIQDEMFSDLPIIIHVEGLSTKADHIVQVKTIEINTILDRYCKLIDYIENISGKDELGLEGLKLQIFREIIQGISKKVGQREFKNVTMFVMRHHTNEKEFATKIVDEFINVFIGGEGVVEGSESDAGQQE